MHETLARRFCSIQISEDKHAERAELERQTAEYEARGGKIETVEPHHFKVHNDARTQLVINADRESERTAYLNTIPLERRNPRIESGWIGISRDKGDKWKVRWQGHRIPCRFNTIAEAVAAQDAYIQKTKGEEQ